MAAVYAYNVLTSRDPQSTKYIERYADHVPASVALKQAAQAVPAASASASGESAELFGQQCLGLGGGIALQALFHCLHQWSVRAGKLCALTGCGCRSRRHRLRGLLEGHRRCV